MAVAGSSALLVNLACDAGRSLVDFPDSLRREIQSKLFAHSVPGRGNCVRSSIL